ncbi:class I adenylate-forming enzyme family protein [Hahella sp. HN01]|uniref:class I adenylate-forming enzyme family protein n=1 Tax=Hahella sp. HN01 TaxID=2847262 RepID=UPI001C1EA3F5|nr:class I adenylate-forming enzyme family protein [Hahella sp. HN01]MBU6952869.1 acyl--CoA ligase [Hahella sp. HN01]
MLFARFVEQAQRFPEKEAVVWRETSYSYREMISAAVGYARELRAAGVGPGEAVAALVPNSIYFVATSLAVWANGGVLLPLNVAYTQEETALYLDNARVRFAFVVPDAEAKLPAEMARCVIGLDDGLPVTDEAAPEVRYPGAADAVIMFSSGSTGAPKQVVRTQAQVLAEVEGSAVTLRITHEDVIACSVPLFHAHGFGNCFLAALMNGGTLLIHHGEFNARKMMRLVSEYQATLLPSVPFMCKMMAMTPFRQAPDLSRLRLAYTAGAPLEEDIFTGFREAFGIPLGQLYGSTETGAAAVNAHVSAANFRSVGKPVSGSVIRLIDDEGAPVAAGQEGEVVIDSPAMTYEYRGLPELSAETFRKDGYHTGDLGRLDEEGNLVIVGRKKLMINVAGHKVDPADVEEVIRRIPGVLEVVALGKPDGMYGEMVKVAVKAGVGVTREMVAACCAERLAAYKTPKIIEFVDEIPKSPLGKVLRKYL